MFNSIAMRHYYLLLISALIIASCNRPSVDDPTPAPPAPIPEPPLVEVKTLNDSLYIDSQTIYTRTANTDVSFSCRFVITNNSLKINRIREVGFILSTTDSVLSIKNPQHIRLKASVDTVNHQFTGSSQNLIPEQNYFIEPYFLMNDGRVYYGRYINTPRLQTPSWLPRPPMNAITRFRINQVDKSVYKPITVVSRAGVPLPTLNYDFYPFVCNDNFYVLGRDGNLFLYDTDQNMWLPRQRLKIEPVDRFNGWPARVFGINDKGYVLYTDALVPNPTFYWEYNPDSDQWNKLSTTDKPMVIAPYQYAYQQGNQVFLSDIYQKKIVRFDAVSKDVQLVALPNLTKYLISNRPILTVANTPYAYFTTYYENETGQLNAASYDAGTDTFGSTRQISDKQTDLRPALMGTTTNDIVSGLGYTVKFIRESRINTEIVTANDDMIRYSTTENQVAARYDLSTIRSGNNNNLWATYQSFTVKNKMYVIDRTNGKMWGLSF